MPDAPAASRHRAAGPLVAAGLALLFVLFLGPGRGGGLALLLAAVLPLVVPRSRWNRRDGLVRGLMAGALLAGVATLLLLRSPAALLAAILLLWVVPLAIGGAAGSPGEDPR